MNSVTIPLLSNLITNKIINYFNLSTNEFMLITTLISSTMMALNMDFIYSIYSWVNLAFTMTSILYLFLICCFITSCYYMRKYWKLWYEDVYYEVAHSTDFLTIMKWLEANKACLLNKYDIFTITEHDYRGVYYNNEYHWEIPAIAVDSIVKFRNTNGISGHITMVEKTQNTKDDNKNVVIKREYFMRIYTTNITPKDFYEKNMKENAKKYHETNAKITLRLYKTFLCKQNIEYISHTMYEGESKNRDAMYNKYIASYFSDKRDYIWNYVKQVNDHPDEFKQIGQSPRVSMIFHGPPGTGKSSLVYRLAMATNRHILSIDICNYLNNKK